MSGLLYKNFRVNRSSLIFTIVIQVIISSVIMIMCIFNGGQEMTEEGARMAVIVFAVLYFLGYMLPSMLSGEVFRNDESRVCCSFAMSSPAGAKGHVAAKYYYILIVYIAILFCDFITDTLAFGFTGGMVSVNPVLMILFCYRLLLAAIEIPFMIRFGSERGVNIKGAVMAGVIMLIMLYFLFGDISFLIDNDGEDMIVKLLEWLQSGDVVNVLAAFPYISVAAYYISYRISVKLYRKGAENYEQ